MVIVLPLNLGTAVVDKSVFTYLANQGKKIIAPFIAYYIVDGQKKILVDTGPRTLGPARRFHPPFIQGKEQRLPNALNNLGFSIEDVDLVINTHLHWDHCSGNRYFKGTEVVLQRIELRYALAPAPVFSRAYEFGLPGIRQPFLDSKFHLVSGYERISKNVSVLPLPGHTPGMQGVVVRSGSKTFVIAGDAVPLFENWQSRIKIPPGVHTSLEDCYASFRKIEKLADFILPGHDRIVFRRKYY